MPSLNHASVWPRRQADHHDDAAGEGEFQFLEERGPGPTCQPARLTMRHHAVHRSPETHSLFVSVSV
ncbi:hypothetical protein E2562_023277 [Oryza meyeriana var. granulata]|uniref:Uncharacterized protein n=1 Tax=Oryza meyeriana var. granulata TaxID=110450 RepID=A0A6G1DM16_9ORYZ|nr:hypothetical protein E2562_023277 [Oryza meyeriana var. granulata]